jgi:hypothetical protein
MNERTLEAGDDIIYAAIQNAMSSVLSVSQAEFDAKISAIIEIAEDIPCNLTEQDIKEIVRKELDRMIEARRKMIEELESKSLNQTHT